MNFFPNLLAILAILLPLGSGETSDPIVLGSSAAQWADLGDLASDRIYSPAHLPLSCESFFECLDETALDEEDSNPVEDHGIAPLTFLDFETSLVSDNSSSFLPA